MSTLAGFHRPADMKDGIKVAKNFPVPPPAMLCATARVSFFLSAFKKIKLKYGKDLSSLQLSSRKDHLGRSHQMWYVITGMLTR